MSTTTRFQPTTGSPQAYCDVRIAGEIDASNADDCERQIMEAVNNSQLNAVLVDMSNVKFLGVAGLNALVRVFQQARQQKRRLVLVNVSPEAQRSLELARLDEAFPIRAYLA